MMKNLSDIPTPVKEELEKDSTKYKFAK